MSGIFRSLLSSQKFLPLFSTQFLSAFNDNIFRNALIVTILYHISSIQADHKNLFVTLSVAIFMLPFFLFSATAGIIADKFDKAYLIKVIKFIELFVMALGIIGFIQNSLYILYLSLFLTGTLAAFFGPLKYSIIPDHVEESKLIAANGLIESATFIAILLGTAMGAGYLITEESYSITSASIFIMIIAAISFFAALFIPNTKYQADAELPNFNIFKDTARIINVAKGNYILFLTITGLSWFWAIGGIILTQIPELATNVLHANQGVYTFIMTIFCLGIGLGSIFCNSLLKGEVSGKYIPLASLIITIFLFDLSWVLFSYKAQNTMEITLGKFFYTTSHIRIVFDLFMITFAAGIYSVPLYALMQKHSEDSNRSKAIAANNVLNACFMVIATIIAGIVSFLGGSIATILFCFAVINLFVTIYICGILPDLLLKSLLKKLLQFFYKVEVRGIENYQASGNRVLIIANHTSFLDALLLGVFLPDKLSFAINTYIAQKAWIKPFLKLADTLTIDQLNPMAAKTMINYLKKDKKVVIFPEGRITVTGSMMKVYEGPAMIADKSAAILLPVYIDGAIYTHFSRIKKKIKPKLFQKITLTILPPTKIELGTDITGRVRRKKLGEELYNIMSNSTFLASDYKKTLFEDLIKTACNVGMEHIIAEDINRTSICYRKLIAASFTLGNKFTDNTEIKENVAVMVPNSVAALVAYFGLHCYGRVPVMLNFSAGEKNILSACTTAKISTLISSKLFIEKAGLNKLITTLILNNINVIYLEDIKSNTNFVEKLLALIKAYFPNYFYKANFSEKTLPKPDDIAAILFTSGSEGVPKGVALSHTNFNANRMQLASRVDFSQNDRVFNALPMFHSFGLTGGTLLPILSGIKVFFYPSPLHYRIIPELVYDTDATILFGTDTFLNGYAKYAHQYDFYSVRYIFAGAEKLESSTKKFFQEKFGVRIFEGYGATETSPVISTNTPMHAKDGTVGKILPGMIYRLEKVDGITEGGNLVVAGPNIMMGYILASNPGIIIPPKNNEYVTGDIVEIDKDGYIKIVGRAKRFAKIGGEMVSLAAIEAEIKTLRPDYNNAVIAIKDDKKGEQLILFVDNHIEKRDLLDYWKSKGLAEIMLPKTVIKLDKLPILATGKVDYQALKNLREIKELKSA